MIDGSPCTDTTPCSVESILASAGHGLQTLDSADTPGSGPYLTDLRLDGDVLSWSHDGSPRSAALGP